MEEASSPFPDLEILNDINRGIQVQDRLRALSTYSESKYDEYIRRASAIAFRRVTAGFSFGEFPSHGEVSSLNTASPESLAIELTKLNKRYSELGIISSLEDDDTGDEFSIDL